MGKEETCQLSTDERKAVLRAMQKETLIIVSRSTEQGMRNTTESEVLKHNFICQIWENAQRRLRAEGRADLLERSKLGDFDHAHRIHTILGNLQIAYQDLRDAVPTETDLDKLRHWDALWVEQQNKESRMKQLDPQRLNKRTRIYQEAAAGTSTAPDTSGTSTIMRTAYNSLCTHLIGIPHEVLKEGATLGAGAFGEVKEYKIQGVSFFPEHITYCGKLYKGDSSQKFTNFQTEQGMQVLHPSIVRCIAFTKESPWITIFPYFNGGSIGDMLLWIPVRKSAFAKAIHRLDRGFKEPFPTDRILTEVQIARARTVIVNMPHIMHAIVDGMAAAHTAGILHTDVHPFNLVLDFIRDSKVRVGIIDWGMMLRFPNKRASINFVTQPEKNPEKVAAAQLGVNRELQKRPWLAPELYNCFLADAYTTASDVYAVGFLLQALHEFWKIGQDLWMGGTIHDAAVMEMIDYKTKNWMLLPDAADRKSMVQMAEYFKSLKTEPMRAQRPLSELSVAFNPL